MPTRWGIIGCGDVTEVKSGPGFQRAQGSALLAVMRRDLSKAQDYARRHGVPRAYDDAAALIADPDVDVVYIATPPSSHLRIALAVAAAGKPCLVEKPMAMNHAECVQMNNAFRARNVPLWVAYYRRALPRFVEIKPLLDGRRIGEATSVHVHVTDRPPSGAVLENWRFDPSVGGAGLFADLGSHCFDLVDFLLGPIAQAHGVAANTTRVSAAADVVAAVFGFARGVVGTATFNFNADVKADRITIIGTAGTITTPVFADEDAIVQWSGRSDVVSVRNPPHVHQPLIQTIVDELGGRGICPSTGESGARASWVMDRCVAG
jgi:1,5-anhydro-D-fructose reductase (1,5-anhydro-D-mannitol-forming)